MRMMRINEAVDAIGGGMTRYRLYGLIARGHVPAARIGGILLVDLDRVQECLERYKPGTACGDGMVSMAELIRCTGLSLAQIRHGIKEGWVIQYTRPGSVRRKYYKPAEVLDYCEKLLRGGEPDDNRGHTGPAASPEAGSKGQR